MLVRRVASACVWGGCIWSPMRLQSQSSRGLPSTAWSDGAVDPRFAAGPTNARTLNPDTMAHYVKATIQNDRREMGLGQIVDWAEFAKEAIFIPTRSGPLWVGADDPRAAKFVRRREKMRAKPLQKARPKAGPDPAAALESHPLREYFTTPTNINDPLSVATGLHRAGMIKEMDIKHTAAKMAYAPRPPIVSIMGHVDHGKTTLLDFLRKTNVASAEAGGITQNVGAFCVRTGTDTSGKDRIITFIDTPGHAAFSAMREAGAAANDIIVLIVSAVDGVQPQTREVLDLATRNGLPLVVAISKIDRQPNCQQVMAQLRDAGVELEEDGGDVQVVKICARDGSGVPQLLEALQLQAELCEISSPQPARAELTVMESQRSAVHEVSAIVRTGTVRVGQVFVAGMTYGVVRRLINESGEGITSAGPSTPVVLHGFSVSPKPGSILMQVSSEKHAEKFHFFMKEVYQVEGGREGYLQLVHAEQRGQFYARKPDNNLVRSFSTKAFLLTCKAATFGMLQALMRMVYELPRLEGVSVEMKLTEVGGLQDHDLGLMGGSGRPGCILIFGDCRDANTLDVPDQIKVIRFDVLYHGLEQLKELLVDALPKVAKTRILATAECLQTFKASQAGKNGNAGGMRVVSGTLDAAHPTFRVMRRVRRPAGAKAAADEAEQREVVYEGQLKELRRFKDLVPSVEEGLECGVILRDEFIFKTGDRLEQVEAYEESRDVAEEFEAAERRERILRETASLQEGLAEEAATTSDEKA